MINSVRVDLVHESLGDISDYTVGKVFITTHSIKGINSILGIKSVRRIASTIEHVDVAMCCKNLNCSNNTIKLIPVIKAGLAINTQPYIIVSEDLNKSLQFFDSLISKNAEA